MSKNHKIYLATISEGCRDAAKQYGLGLECDTFCTAVNLENPEMIRQAEQQLDGFSHKVLHAPFNELCPAAIEPEVVRITRMRYEQAWEMAQKLGIHRMVVHSGYIPLIYFPEWFTEKSIAFWKEFLKDKPEDCEILLENVLEGEPDMTASIVEAVDDPRLKLCLDIGHANSEVSISLWRPGCAAGRPGWDMCTFTTMRAAGICTIIWIGAPSPWQKPSSCWQNWHLMPPGHWKHWKLRPPAAGWQSRAGSRSNLWKPH